MTTYTVTATATTATTNRITVATTDNMFSGMPIVFSGTTFGGITAGATYYIGTITIGYPTSTITVNSLPGGGVYVLTTATGTMTGTFNSGGQQIISTVPPGEPLNESFNAVNLNFDQVFAAGPVGSNIQIANNTILTTNTNGNLVLSPNGVGVVQSNVSILPNTANIRNLGGATRRWGTVYTQYLDITAGSLTVPAVITNSISSDDSTFVTIADGLNVDGDIETHGNITAEYFIGNGSQLTGITGGIQSSIVNGNSNVNIAASGGNITMGVNGTAGIVTITKTGANITGTANVSGNITGNYFVGNGSLLTSLTGANVTGTVANATSATTAGTVTSNAQANITSVGTLTSLSSSGNVTGGNILTGGIVSATGNATAGNVLTAGLISATSNITGGNVLTGGLISATSNITGGNLNSPTLNNSGNIRVVAGGNAWTFGSTGNLTLPANTFSVNYANGNAVTFSGGNATLPLANGTSNFNIATANGNATITAASDKTWIFGSNGNLTVPGNILGSGNILIAPNSASASSYLDIYLTGGPDIHIASNDNSIVIGRDTGANIFVGNDGDVSIQADSGTPHVWDFDNTGTTQFPGNLLVAPAGNPLVIKTTSGNVYSTLNTGALGGYTSIGIQDDTTGAYQGWAYVKTNMANVNTPSAVVVVKPGNTGTEVTWTFDAVGNLTLPSGGNLIVSGAIVGSGASPAPSLSGFSNVNAITLSASGNVTGGNVRTVGLISATGNATAGNVLTGGIVSATGNVTGGNLITAGSGGNITLTGGNITGANVVTANSFVGNGATLSNVATTFESTWTVPVGNSTQSFTVSSGTYSMWVDCNIPNGILAWNATGTITNTNVPVAGVQYAWVYNGGGTPIDFTSIPNQFVGTANTIVRSNVAPSATTNRFDFGINNTSGGNVTVRYGWAQIS